MFPCPSDIQTLCDIFAISMQNEARLLPEVMEASCWKLRGTYPDTGKKLHQAEVSENFF